MEVKSFLAAEEVAIHNRSGVKHNPRSKNARKFRETIFNDKKVPAQIKIQLKKYSPKP